MTVAKTGLLRFVLDVRAEHLGCFDRTPILQAMITHYLDCGITSVCLQAFVDSILSHADKSSANIESHSKRRHLLLKMAGLESSTLLTCHEGAAEFDDLFKSNGRFTHAGKFSSSSLVAATSYTRTDEHPLTTILSSTLGGGRKAGNLHATHAGVASGHLGLRNSASVDRESLLLAHKANAAQVSGQANKKLSITMMGNTYEVVVGILQIMDGAVEAGMQALSLLPHDYYTSQMHQPTVEELLTTMLQLKKDGRIRDLTFGGGSAVDQWKVHVVSLLVLPTRLDFYTIQVSDSRRTMKLSMMEEDVRADQ